MKFVDSQPDAVRGSTTAKSLAMILVSVCAVLASSGCGTIMAIKTDSKSFGTAPPRLIYGGMTYGECMFQASIARGGQGIDGVVNGCCVVAPASVVDVALSAVADTLILPYTVPRSIYRVRRLEAPADTNAPPARGAREESYEGDWFVSLRFDEAASRSPYQEGLPEKMSLGISKYTHFDSFDNRVQGRVADWDSRRWSGELYGEVRSGVLWGSLSLRNDVRAALTVRFSPSGKAGNGLFVFWNETSGRSVYWATLERDSK